MKRFRQSAKKAGKEFARTAKKARKLNLLPTVSFGGIRL